jgi:hypothetical protein
MAVVCKIRRGGVWVVCADVLRGKERLPVKVLVIPDVHLKPEMFDQADSIMKRGAAECAACLMDIPDDWGQELNIDLYINTFDAAIKFAKKYPDTRWVYGNHDLSYLWNKRESGYSSFAADTVCRKLAELQRALPEENEMRYIHRIDNVAFCHGGIMDFFVKKFVSASEEKDIDEVIEALNSLSNEEMWKDISPIWFRPQLSGSELYKEGELLQVVGHTPVKEVYKIHSLVSCDVFSTYRDGTAIGKREFLVIDTKTWEIERVAAESLLCLEK